MSNFESGALDEGAISFKKIDDDTFAIMGTTLLPGEEVEVTTKNGDVRKVIVGEIIEEQDGIQTTTFEWVNEPRPGLDYAEGKIYFHQLDNGEYTVRGMNLAEGETVEVSVKDGSTMKVVVTQILEADEDGIQTAAFEWPLMNPDDLLTGGRVVFTRDDGGNWLIRGRGLETGKTVKVTRKGKTSKEQVIVGDILTDEDGIQTATFTNPKKKGGDDE